ncbi:MAG: hypothetical protein HY222_06270 [Thaumarchaeota archaeon]|nr:hypothetical protein [Nitrososphaerota archaeon]MBI3641981.1 hypothetical protein [Nitrososphaerota archaeon]
MLAADAQDLIKILKMSGLFAECPNCGAEFSLKKTLMFDGQKKFPDAAEKKRMKLQQELEERIEDLKKRQVRADKGAEQKAIEVGIGKIIEKVLPAYKDFNMPLADCRFLSEPIDMIVFEGASNMKIKNITFMDVKTGNASLNRHQKLIRDAIEDHKVDCEVLK